MLTVSGVYSLHDFAELVASNTDDEAPKTLVYIYYCEACNSILTLARKPSSLHSFLRQNTCPHCHLKLDITLQCRALICKIPHTTLTNMKQDLVPHVTRKTSPLDLRTFFKQSPSGARIQENVTTPGNPLLSFGNILDHLCGGIPVSKLSVLYGNKVCQRLAEQLCVRAQLPSAAGGLDSSSIFVDGGNLFDPYNVAQYADKLGKDREAILSKVFVSRAFTCYQLTTLILEKLPELIHQWPARLIVVANLFDMFIDAEIKPRERTETVRLLCYFLVHFAAENQIAIVVASTNIGDGSLGQYLTSRADLVLKAERRTKRIRFVLEKHSSQPRSQRIIQANSLEVTASRPKKLPARDALRTFPIFS